jgi:hypothetical protein
VEFTKKQKLLLKENKVNDRIHGYIREDYKTDFSRSDVLVLDSGKNDNSTLVIVSIVSLSINPIHVATNFSSISALGIEVEFRPLLEVSDGYIGDLRAIDLSDFKIRKPTLEEYNLATNLPPTGVPIGKNTQGSFENTCYYPFDPDSDELENTLYQSVFIEGIQGSGKTNALKFLSQAVTSYKGISIEKRPAVIILDGEKMFTEFATKNQLNPEAREFLNENDIGDTDYRVLTLSEYSENADSTLSFQSLTYNDLVHLIPEVEPKTENILKQVLKTTFEIIEARGNEMELTIENVRSVGTDLARKSPLIHYSQAPAIGRALQSIELDMFNQPDKTQLNPSLLFQPGKISVIDVHDLDKSRKRIVALYIQQMLNRFKMEQSNKYPGVILVVDEAEELFPDKPSKRERNFVDRITERMEDVTNRGRKRHYGLFIVTHVPSSVSPKIVALANTHMAFRSSGADSYISKVFGKEFVSQANNLETGTYLLKVNVSSQNQRPIIAKLRMPNMDKCKVKKETAPTIQSKKAVRK